MTAIIRYSKNTDRVKMILEYSLLIQVLIGQILELELSSFKTFPPLYECGRYRKSQIGEFQIKSRVHECVTRPVELFVMFSLVNR